ncbi:MAG TPA: Ig domain-containing protein [Anaerolineales bacterium]|nr:Ig domain-containing protein [Anaerolineales bacterium]
MKHKTLRILSAVSIVMMSLACSMFTRFTRAENTPTPDPYIFPPVTTPLKIEPDSLPNAQTGVEYEVEIRVSDNVTPVNSVSISSGTLPAGLELLFVDGEDGAKISGTPQETGTFNFTVFVSCFGTMVSGQDLEKEFQIVVEE